MSTITIPSEAWESVLCFWEDAMEARFTEAYEWWGNRADGLLWPVYFEQLKDAAKEGCLSDMDPKVIVDNFLVNGEVVAKSEFKEGGNWEYYWRKYNGDWDTLCDDALAHADDPKEAGEAYAIMRY